MAFAIGSNPFFRKGDIRRKPFYSKNWSVEKYLEVARSFENDYRIIFIGGETESKMMSEHRHLFTDNMHDYLGKTSLPQTIHLLSQCDILVGCDTGPIHLASALGVPTLSLFGPTDPEEFAPISDNAFHIFKSIECQPCFGTNSMFRCKDRKCLSLIGVDEVVTKIHGILKEE
jgi:ADP-heptose:LPS heptosyltransferase